MNLHIYFVRHGQQDSDLCNVDVELSGEGRRKARLTGEWLRRYPIGLIYTSHLKRAVETAEIIKTCLDEGRTEPLPCRIRENLQEADFGDLTGIPDKEIAIRYADFMESRYHAEDDWTYPGGESGWDVYRRARQVLDEIISVQEEHVCVVTHGGVIRSFLAVLLEGSPARRLQLGNPLYRGGVTELLYDRATKRFTLQQFNVHSHLTEKTAEGKSSPVILAPAESSDQKALILASGSPRRKEILEQVGARFTVHTSDKEEEGLSGLPWEAAVRQSAIKARDVAEHVTEGVIIGADTVVTLDGRLLGKPKNKTEAAGMLKSLSGRTHEVCTGVTVVIKEKNGIQEEFSFHESTRVGIAELSSEQIEAYTATGEPLDKAGAYAIQGRFAVYVSKLEGDYYNVVGLPVGRLYEMLKKHGISLIPQ